MSRTLPSWSTARHGLAWIYDDAEITTYLLSRVQEQRARGFLSDIRPKSSPGQVVRFDTSSLDTLSTEKVRVRVADPLDHEKPYWPRVSAFRPESVDGWSLLIGVCTAKMPSELGQYRLSLS
jgi:hypothetical protein